MNTIKIAVIHWFPLEQYPPATNLLDYFAAKENWQVSAHSCTNVRGLLAYENPVVKLYRTAFPSGSFTNRLLAYLGFPICVFLRLVITRPQVLLYLEPHSALPAFLYCTLARRCRLFIHYHEYRDQHEYNQPGMRLVRFYHWLERKFLFQRAEWISQTNSDRNLMFQTDIPEVDKSKLQVLPNYPSKNWSGDSQASWPTSETEPLKLVYVGALSLRDTFVGPLVEWFNGDQCPKNVTLDIYSYNSDSETREFLNCMISESVRFHPRGVEYREIPKLLKQFNIGLILYKANSRNYVYNASNKLFEYLAVGLDVWYPPTMLGVKPYAGEAKHPRVIETDFTQLRLLDMDNRRLRPESKNPMAHYFSEDVLIDLESRMISSCLSKPAQ